MLAMAPIKVEKEDDHCDLQPLPDVQEFPYKLQPLDKEEEMEILSSIKQETEETTRDRIVDSLAASYPRGALSKVFQVKEEDDDPLSASCFAEIRLDKHSRMDEGFDSDDELTSLSWLHDTDLLSGLRVGSECGSPCDDDGQKENDFQSGYYGQPHPPHVPYNPQKHVNSKPPYSFSCLIFMAIEDNPDKKLPVKDIYNWILTHFPYFQNAPTGWKNSVRHNLSLNKCFKKVEKDRCSNIGKGSLWMIDPDFRPNLLQALRKTPYHPYHQLQMFNNAPASSPCSTNGTQKPLPLQPRYNVNTPSPHLFPFLSRRLAQSNFVSTAGSDVSVSDIDVANTLVSLKRAAENRRSNGARSRSPSPPEFGSEREKELLKQKQKFRASREEVVWYAPPSDDHSYSLTEELLQAGSMSPESSIDEEYDFGTNDKSTSEMEDEIFSESDYDEEGWSEEEELYEREKLKLYSRAPIITHDSVGSQAGSHHNHHTRSSNHTRRFVTSNGSSATDLLLKASMLKTASSSLKNQQLHHHSKPQQQQLRNPPPVNRRVVNGTETRQRHTQQHHQQQVGGGVGMHTSPPNRHVSNHSNQAAPRSSRRDPEEDLKIAEGANALLNLAGIRSAHIVPLRSISPSHNNNNIVKLENVKVEEDMET